MNYNPFENLDGAHLDGPLYVKYGVYGVAQPAGRIFYVEANTGIDGRDGLSWASAFKTLAAAFVASNAYIALATGVGWASRNIIYYKGDNNEAAAETLITLPSKCDVIGVGSYDGRKQPSLIGNHVIGAGAYMGTRFINMGFQSPAAGGVIFTLPTTGQVDFLNCVFDGRSATPATIAINLTAVEQCQIIGCNFFGKYSTATINIATGSGRAMRIVDNFIESGAIGIKINAGYTCVDAMGAILNNTFAVVTLLLDDDSDTVMFGNNSGATESDGTQVLTLDSNADLAFNNVIACGAGTVSIYPIITATIPT